ncbi:hypothetical protein [Neomoorella thermoacetica]|nr:hypothetical protein [Moorella thermoacetica]
MRSLIIACRVMEDELLSLATGREDLLFLDQGLPQSFSRTIAAGPSGSY